MASARNRRSDAESVIWPQVLLVVAVVALTLIGFVMIYSTSSVIALASASADAVATVDPMADTLSQIKFAVAGIVIALVVNRVMTLIESRCVIPGFIAAK